MHGPNDKIDDPPSTVDSRYTLFWCTLEHDLISAAQVGLDVYSMWLQFVVLCSACLQYTLHHCICTQNWKHLPNIPAQLLPRLHEAILSVLFLFFVFFNQSV